MENLNQQYIPDDNIIEMFRFSERRWNDCIVNGHLSFSCAGAYLKQAIKTNNDIQGDRYEGVFARLKNGDKRIEELRLTLGNDLWIIPEGEYSLLLRKSALHIPIFCFYGYKVRDVLVDAGSEAHVGMNTVRHYFDGRMFTGFVDHTGFEKAISYDHQFSSLILKAPFLTRLRISLIDGKIPYKMAHVDYSKMNNDTFLIPPTQNYDELFNKRGIYEYQSETRIILPEIHLPTFVDRHQIEIGALKTDDYIITNSQLFFDINVNFGKRSD